MRFPRWKSICVHLFLSLIFLMMGLRAGLAQDLFQGLSGLVEFNYVYSESRMKDGMGKTTKTNTSTYNPRLTLNIDTKIFPNLRLHAGGIGELIRADFETGGMDTRGTITRVRPYIDLTLETPLYTMGLGYVMREERSKTGSSPSLTLVNEEYSALLGWRADGLPSLEARWKRQTLYDSQRTSRDVGEDTLNLVSKYRHNGLEFYYNGLYSRTLDDLNDLEQKQLYHSARGVYGGSFWDDRIAVNTTYDLTHQEIKTLSEGKGFVTIPVSAFAGLSRTDDALPPTPILLDQNPALVDGNLIGSAGIDLLSDLPLIKRQMGLDLLNPVEVNQLRVWVDREISAETTRLFLWDVLVSEDNLNWTHWAGPVTASFVPFENRFEIDFPAITPPKRYVKVVTNPLLRSPILPQNLFVTEIQAFRRQSAADTEERTVRTSHLYNFDLKARILKDPMLSYDLSYFFNKVLPDGQRRYNLSNGFSASHRFSPSLSGTARIAREDGEEKEEKRTAYVYHLAMMADPLRTLRHSLVLSGREEEIGKKPNNLRSLFLYNTAQLYEGIDLNLNGGFNFSEKEKGENVKNRVINFGAQIVPHRSLILGLYFSDTESKQKRNEISTALGSNRRVDLSVNYNPLRTVTFFALLQIVTEQGKERQLLQNYSFNWSPFPDGALQFNLLYNETLRSEDRSKERNLTPSMRWKITKRSYLDLAYQTVRSENKTTRTHSRIFSSNLKIFF